MSSLGFDLAREAAGGKNVDLAKLLGITESAVSQWDIVPTDRAIEIEEKTGGRVTRYQIRPDYFGEPPHAKARTAKRARA